MNLVRKMLLSSSALSFALAFARNEEFVMEIVFVYENPSFSCDDLFSLVLCRNSLVVKFDDVRTLNEVTSTGNQTSRRHMARWCKKWVCGYQPDKEAADRNALK